MILLCLVLVAAGPLASVPPAFGTLEADYKDCSTVLKEFLAHDENRYFKFALSLPRCNSTEGVAQERRQCNVPHCDPTDKLVGDSFQCLRSFCTAVTHMAKFATCKPFVCNPQNFFAESYGFAGLKHGPGTMHPCGRSFAMGMINTCHDIRPDELYPNCGPFGPKGAPKWRDMATRLQDVLVSLGWTERVWGLLDGIELLPPEAVPTKQTFPLVERTCWGDLTSEEQEKLREIGWNSEGWITCGYLAKRFRKTCQHPADVVAEDANCATWRRKAEQPLWGQSEDSHIGTVRANWDSMSVEDKRNWAILGFTNNTWNSGEFAGFPLRTKKWNELSELQQTSAKYFHFNIFSWNGCELMSCLDRLAYAERFTSPTIATRRWETLTPAFREWLTAIGWTEMGWATGETPIPMTRAWDSIDAEVQSFARLFGHSKDTWERCPQANCLQRLQYLMNKWWPKKNNGRPLEWNTMPQQWQRDWSNLGYTMQTWNEKGKPLLHYNSWDSMTDDQRESARNLGYSMSAWDGCANPDRTEEDRSASGEVLDPFRLVQAKMTIHRSFTEISKLGKVTSSFLDVFRTAVASVMFCRNEYEKDFDGQCYDRDSYQRQADRLFLVRVDDSPVAVHFRVIANRTANEFPSVYTLQLLKAALEDPDSSIRTDEQFERFARVAKVEEIPFNAALHKLEQQEINFETIRKGDRIFTPDHTGAQGLLSLPGLFAILLVAL